MNKTRCFFFKFVIFLSSPHDICKILLTLTYDQLNSSVMSRVCYIESSNHSWVNTKTIKLAFAASPTHTHNIYMRRQRLVDSETG